MATVRGTDDPERIDRADGVTDEFDWIFGRGGDDTIFGFGGDDQIRGGAGADIIDGGIGTDTVYYDNSSSGVVVSLAARVGYGGTAEGDELYNIENVVGSSHDDDLRGDSGANDLWGGSGDDRLMGGEGADNLYGGADWDTADYYDSLRGVTVSLGTGEGSGGAAEGDRLFDIEVLSGSTFNDFLQGDSLDNTLIGMHGDDILDGLDGNDRLFGGAGNDTLKAGGGADRLEGGTNHDTLLGGLGADTLLGGEGADTFVWTSTAETGTTFATADVVGDFNRRSGDLLDFRSIDANQTVSGNQSFTFIGTANFSAAGQIRWSQDEAGNTWIALNTDADSSAEALIRLDSLQTVNEGWFLL